MSRTNSQLTNLAIHLALASALSLACSSSDNSPGGTSNTGGTAGSGGGGSAGTSGAGVANGGTAGQGGATAGTAGQAAGGTSGSAGAGGAAGSGGGGAGGQGAGAGGGGAGGAGGTGGTGGAGGAAPFALTSPVLMSDVDCAPDLSAGCGEFPEASLHTPLGGQNESPELDWGSEPAGTMSYAVVLHDLTFNNTHWAMWNIPAGSVTLPTGLPGGAMPTMPAGASQASFIDGEGYVGPGVSGNVYEFKVYALNVATFTPGNANEQNAVRGELENDQDGIVLDSSTLRGKAP